MSAVPVMKPRGTEVLGLALVLPQAARRSSSRGTILWSIWTPADAEPSRASRLPSAEQPIQSKATRRLLDDCGDQNVARKLTAAYVRAAALDNRPALGDPGHTPTEQVEDLDDGEAAV